MASDDINLQPTKIHEKDYNDIIKTLQYIEIIYGRNWNYRFLTGHTRPFRYYYFTVLS